MSHVPSRRTFISIAGGLAFLTRRAEAKKETEEEVSPTEDLMREHGVVRRVLLVYREAERRLEQGLELPAETLIAAGTLVREFIEDYHERDEEEFLFPCFDGSTRLAPLVATLRRQHAIGRGLTTRILENAQAGLSAERTRRGLGASLRDFVRMYDAHAAYEDTILFPAFRELVPRRDLDRIQEIFEQKEHALPHGGFEAHVEQVAALERSLGILGLATFSPSPPAP